MDQSTSDCANESNNASIDEARKQRTKESLITSTTESAHQ